MPRGAVFQHVNMEKDHALWRFYRHPGDEHELPTRPSYAIVAACYQAKLFRIIDESLNLYCGARGQVSAEKFLAVYRRYMDWRSDLPSVIANVDVADQPLPHILYLQYVSAFKNREHVLTVQRAISHCFGAACQPTSPLRLFLPRGSC